MSCIAAEPPIRLLVVPGLNDSGPAHWQTWLESLHRDALRVRQDDWSRGEVERWARRLQQTIESQPPARWAVAAHSFGCLTLARLAQLRPELPIVAALLVAPASPERFGIAGLLPHEALPFRSTLVASRNDPWLGFAEAERWALRWGSRFVDLGYAGHINADSGFGPLPLAQRWLAAVRRQALRGDGVAPRAHEVDACTAPRWWRLAASARSARAEAHLAQDA